MTFNKSNGNTLNKLNALNPRNALKTRSALKVLKQSTLILLIIASLLLTGCVSAADGTSNVGGYGSDSGTSGANSSGSSGGEYGGFDGGDITNSAVSLDEIPTFEGDPYIVINDNIPGFTDDDFAIADESAFEEFTPLDRLGRCGEAYANVCQELMPTEKRGSIGQVKPTGWQVAKYDFVDGKYLYNRCHLLGFQLTGENANRENLITGTRYMNVDGMLPFEDMIADFVKETDEHVLYRVTPIFAGDDLVATGVQMEAASVEDRGQSIQFNVFCYNVQPGVDIDYADGSSRLAKSEDYKADSSYGNESLEIRGNKNSKIYHCPGQRDYDLMADSGNLVIFRSEEDAINAGYRKAKN